MDIYRHFGLRKGDPFLAAPRFDWTGTKRIATEMRRAAKESSWLLLYGPPGAGKTEGMNAFVEQCGKDYHIAHCLSTAREDLQMTCVHQAFVLDLDMAGRLGERPTKHRESRVRQLLRLLAMCRREKPVILMLDEASRIGTAFFDDIKFLRDLRWSGDDIRSRRPYFAVVMLGWESLAKRIARSDQNRIRVRRWELPPMAQAEVHDFVAHVGLSRVVPEATRVALFRSGIRYPGEIAHALRTAMERAAARGLKQVRPEHLLNDVAAIARALRDRDISFATVARQSGHSPALVTRVLSGTYAGKASTIGQVLQTAQRMIAYWDMAQDAERPHRRRGPARKAG